jgi:hypothetical protein
VNRLAVLLVLAAGCKKDPAVNAVPHTTGPIQIDGEWDEADWPKVALRRQLRGDDGQLARPSSELRFLRDDHDLLVALYAADDNIETRDAFDLTIGTLVLHVPANGQVSPVVSGLRAKSGFDEGTIDNPKDDDEEWVVELAIPLETVGRGTKDVHVGRCDVQRKDGEKRCASWSGTITIE